MATRKVTITLPEQTLADIREHAEAERVSVSAWLDRAARERSRRVGLTRLADYERKLAVEDPGWEAWEEWRMREAWRDYDA